MAETAAPNVFLVSGTDSAGIRAEAEKLVRQFAGEAPDAFALDIVREREGVSTAQVVNELIRSVLSPSLLGGRKTVWLQDFQSFDAEGAASSRTPEAAAFRELCGTIAAGLPPDIVLIMSGPGLDQRKALTRQCKAHGQVRICTRPEVGSRNWEQQMLKLVRARATDKGVTLDDQVCMHLVDVIGTDTDRIDAELEKLICYCGDDPITLGAAREVCVGAGETVAWALRDAVGARDLPEALRLVDVFMRQGRDADRTALGLLMQTARCFRDLLQARVLMQELHVRAAPAMRGAVDGMDEATRRQYRENGLELVGYHPFRVQMLCQHALNYGGHELVHAVRVFRDGYWQCISSTVSARVVLEEALVRLVKPRPAARRRARRAQPR